MDRLIRSATSTFAMPTAQNKAQNPKDCPQMGVLDTCDGMIGIIIFESCDALFLFS